MAKSGLYPASLNPKFAVLIAMALIVISLSSELETCIYLLVSSSWMSQRISIPPKSNCWFYSPKLTSCSVTHLSYWQQHPSTFNKSENQSPPISPSQVFLLNISCMSSFPSLSSSLSRTTSNWFNSLPLALHSPGRRKRYIFKCISNHVTLPYHTSMVSCSQVKTKPLTIALSLSWNPGILAFPHFFLSHFLLLPCCVP